jgi:hypothetical protein
MTLDANFPLIDVADREYVRIDDHGPATVVHQLRRHESQRCEGLQVIHAPLALHAIAKKHLTFPGQQEGVILGFDEFDIELVVVPGKVAQGSLTYVGTKNLLVIDMDEYAGFGSPALLYCFTHALAPEEF